MNHYQDVLNADALDNLRDVLGGDDQILLELIRSFLTDAPRLLEKVEQGLEKGDTAAVHLNAHSLKSNSADFGALELAELCRQMEFLGKSGDLRDAPALLTNLQDELSRSETALKYLLQSLG